MGDGRRKAKVFIAYQSSELQLADTLFTLFRAWGCKPFHCRHDPMDDAFYRTELRERLRECDLVVMLLSPEFQWSQYCQAEAGTTMALKKAFIPIIIPPATKESINREVAQVLEGCDFISAVDAEFIAKLRGRVVKQLRNRNAASRKVMARLARLANDRLMPLKTTSEEEEHALKTKVQKVMTSIERRYLLHQPPRQLLRMWPSLANEDCYESIVRNIVHSLKSSLASTDLVFVGVSLKFSLQCIHEALNRVRRKTDDRSPEKKKLAITMVHMNEQAHILHALNLPDIKIINDNFIKDWHKTQQTWSERCEAQGIELVEPKRCQIDYLPPLVGILIDDSLLYAGRCAFHRHGAGDHAPLQLLVGELPYLFYRNSGSNNEVVVNAIREFKACLQAYQDASNNHGITPVWKSGKWIERLGQYCDGYEGREPVIFISGTATKFEPLIRLVIEQERATARVYVHDVEQPSKRIAAVQERLRKNIGHVPARLEVRAFKHSATFRAVVVGDVAIGLQSYVNEGAESDVTAQKLDLCLIATPCFAHFDALRQSIVRFAEGHSDAVSI